MAEPAGALAPLDVLVVGWFPSAGDPGAGRFIADQVAALRATGRIRPWIATFEAIPLFGDERLRSAAERVSERHLVAAIERGESPFVPRGVAGPDGIPVARLGFPAGETKRTGAEHGLLHREAVLAALVRRLDRPGWRLVHGHVGYPEGAAAARVASRLRVPFVLTEHATYLDRIFRDSIQRSRYLETVRGAARIVTVTRLLASELVDELGRDIPDLAERLSVIPNAIAVDDFPVVEPQAREPAELLWVGYRKPVKGIDTLLKAFARVHRTRPEARLRLIGASVEPTGDAYWERLAADLGIRDAVSIEGPADRATVASAMARATLFVHPSHRETFGVVAAEALATGLPIVATDSGGVTEILGPEPEQLGALVPRGDPDALATAILSTLERRQTFDPWRLRRWVEEHYGARVVAEKLVELYAEVLETTPSGADPGRGAVAVDRPGARSTSLARRVVIVGFHRSVLDRALARRPALSHEVVVSAGRPGPTGRWVLAGAETGRRIAPLLARGWRPPPARSAAEALRQAIRAGLLAARTKGRRLWARLVGTDDDALLIDELRQVLASALADGAPNQGGRTGVVRNPDEAPLLVCVTGFDHLVAEPFVRAGARMAPGGLDWLADRQAARDQPESGAGSTSLSRDQARRGRAPRRAAGTARRPSPS